jgi:hypothetical protein
MLRMMKTAREIYQVCHSLHFDVSTMDCPADFVTVFHRSSHTSQHMQSYSGGSCCNLSSHISNAWHVFSVDDVFHEAPGEKIPRLLSQDCMEVVWSAVPC